MASKTRDELLQEARARGLDADALSDDSTIKEISAALDRLGPAPDEAARQAVTQADSGEELERFARQRLVQDAYGFFRCPGHVVAGALAGVDKEQLTLPEAQAAIDEWLKSTVQEA